MGTDNKEALLDACRDFDIDKVEYYLSENSDVDITDIFGEISSPCFGAEGKSGREKLLLLVALANHGADVNVLNSSGHGLVHYLCMYPNRDTPVLPKLIVLGADINVQCKEEGFTPLTICCRRNFVMKDSEGFHNNAKLLLKSGANVHLRDKTGKTALHHLVTSNHSDMAEMLADMMLKEGLDISARDSLQQTPLHLCHFTQVIRENGGVITAAWDEYLILHGSNANFRDCTRDKELAMERRFNNSMFFKGINLFNQFGRGARKPTSVFPFSLKRILLLSIKSGLDLGLFSTDLMRSVVVELLKTRNFRLVWGVTDAGANYRIKQWTMHGFEKDTAHFVAALKSYELTLKRRAANAIRSSLQPNALLAIDGLGLPRSLREYIILHEFTF